MNAGRTLLVVTSLAIGIPVLIGASSFSDASHGPTWAKQAQAGGSNKELAQVVLFQGEIRKGKRTDRDDPYLPPLDEEASEGRAVNYERCSVALDTYLQTGQVRQAAFDHPKTLFAAQVGGQRWAQEGPDEGVLEDLACFFAAGDARRTLVFPVSDEHGNRLGAWRHGRFIRGNGEW